MAKKPKADGLPEMTVDRRGPSDLWTLKDEINQREWRSRNFWKDIEDDQRLGVLLAVKDTLLRLLENLDGWVPLSLDPQTNHRIDLCITLELPAILEEALRQRVSLERIRNHTEAELMRIERDLRAKEVDGGTTS